MNSVVTKDNSVAIENGKDMTQISYDKCFYVATGFQHGTISRKHFCHEKTSRVDNKEQQNSVATRKSLLRQEFEEQYKRNDDKESYVVT